MQARGEFAVAARDTALDGGRSSEGCDHEIALGGDGVIGETGPGVGIGGGIQAREFAGHCAGDFAGEIGCVLGIFFKPVS